MANDQGKNPTNGEETDISKAQAQQQPAGHQREQSQFDADRQEGQPGKGPQGDTVTEQRTDIEGGSTQLDRDKASGGFVGSDGQRDRSSELIEEEDKDFAGGGQGAPERK